MRVLSEGFSRMNLRERLIVVGGGMGAIAMLLWALAVEPMYAKADQTRLLVERKLKTTGELAQVLADYRRQEARVGDVKSVAADKDFSLLSFLEGLAQRSNVKGNIKYMRPTTTDIAAGVREHSVEVKLSDIRLPSMVSLLTAVEKAPQAIQVKRLHVRRRFADPNLLDVTFVVARYEEA
ncbi:MAG: type II secretion system protein GspM [Leptospirillia bacterium]